MRHKTTRHSRSSAKGNTKPNKMSKIQALDTLARLTEGNQLTSKYAEHVAARLQQLAA
jgi:hypothetical protein